MKPEGWPALQAAYAEAVRDLDAGIVDTFLLQSWDDPEIWRVATVWSSRDMLMKMRRSGGTPRGITVFREAGSEPQLANFDVVARGVAD